MAVFLHVGAYQVTKYHVANGGQCAEEAFGFKSDTLSVIHMRFPEYGHVDGLACVSCHAIRVARRPKYHITPQYPNSMRQVTIAAPLGLR